MVSHHCNNEHGQAYAYLRVDEWYDTSLRDDDVAEELVQPIASASMSRWGHKG